MGLRVAVAQTYSNLFHITARYVVHGCSGMQILIRLPLETG